MSVGQSPEYWEDNLTTDVLEDFYSYWETHPPQHILFAAYVGFKATPKATALDFIMTFPNGTIG